MGILFSRTYNGSSDFSYAAAPLIPLMITYATRSPRAGADPGMKNLNMLDGHRAVIEAYLHHAASSSRQALHALAFPRSLIRE